MSEMAESRPPYAYAHFKELSDKFFRLLRLNGYPVAVKLFRELKELEELEKRIDYVKRADKRLAICQIICQAYYLGRVRSGTAKELDNCLIGATGLGLTEMPEEYKDGSYYVGIYHLNHEAGKKTIEQTPMFSPKQYKAMLTAPLERCPIEPDVVLFIGKPAQIFLLPLAYFYDKGGVLTFNSSGLFGCLDSIVAAIKNKKPSVALPCNGFRIRGGLSSENEILCGVPGEMLKKVLEGLKFLYKGGVRYPPAWQHIDLEVRQVPLPHYAKEY